MDADNTLAQIQQQISALQEQGAQTSQENQKLHNHITHANQTIASINQSGIQVERLKTGKLEKFTGQNVRSWPKSLDNIFSTQPCLPTDVNRIKYAVSYMGGAGLQWWELVKLNGTPMQTYADFQREILSYFEPVNRELTARKHSAIYSRWVS